LGWKELQEKIDIVEYVGQYVQLAQQNNEYWGISPFSGKDQNPSFSVSEETQLFYDFSDGCGGSVLTFIEKYNKTSFSNACRIAEQYLGVDSEKEQYSSLDAVKEIKKFRRQKKTEKESTYEVIPNGILNKYLFDKDKLAAWNVEGISYDVMKEYGVAYDKSSNRIIYPIMNMNNDIINISGRTIDPQWKEKKLKKYTYFYPLGKLDVLYGLNVAMDSVKQKKEIILCEGAKSVLMAKTWGYDNVCAVLTSHLNDEQLRILISLGVNVVFALDEDVDIIKDKNIQKLKRFCNVYWAKNFLGLLGEKESPFDNGVEVWKTLYANKFLV